jgi:hypothetical protein
MDSSEDFDPRNYQTLPRLPLVGLLGLARDLLQRTPKPPPERVLDAAQRVRVELEQLEAAIGKWRSVASEATLAEEAALDAFVDGLWTSLRMRLESWSIYERAELLSLSTTRRGKVDYQRYIASAQRARDILETIFGEDGTNFVQHDYTQQAAAMAGVLKIIDDEELGDGIDALVGSDLLLALRDCQGRYESMVCARTTREQALGLSLRKLGEHLRWELNLLVIHVLGSIERGQPSSVAGVKHCLQPILDARSSTRVRADGGVSGEWSIEAVRRGL